MILTVTKENILEVRGTYKAKLLVGELDLSKYDQVCFVQGAPDELLQFITLKYPKLQVTWTFGTENWAKKHWINLV